MVIRVNINYILINYGVIVYIVKEIVYGICNVLVNVFFVVVFVGICYFVN